MSPQLRAAWIATAIWILFFGFHFLSEVGRTGLAEYDEFLTLDRTLSISTSENPFFSWNNQVPCFNKPPLQYLLSHRLIKFGINQEVAVKLPSAIFSLMSLACLGLLAHHLCPDDPWIVLTSVILMSGSGIFARVAPTARLDSGLVFFVILSLLAALKAQEARWWWIVWGLACGLGGVQKAPVALVISSIVIAFLARPARRIVDLFKDRFFLVGCLLGLGTPLLWFLVARRVNSAALSGSSSRLWLRLVSGIDENKGEGMGFRLDWLNWFLKDSSVLWVLVLAVFSIGVVRGTWTREKELSALLLPAALFALVFTVMAGPKYSHYLLVVSPILIVCTAVAMSRLSPRSYAPPVLAVILFFLNSQSLGLLPFEKLRWQGPDFVVGCRYLSEHLSEGEQPVLWVDNEQASAASVYARLPVPIRYISSEQFKPESGKFLVLGKTSKFQQEKFEAENRTVVKQVGRYSLWRGSGP